MTVIDFTLDENNFRAAQSFVTDCIQKKGVTLPRTVAAALENFKLEPAPSKGDPTPNEVFDKLVSALTKAGASPNDAGAFATCVRSMLDGHGGNIEEFIRRGFGYVNFGTESNQFALVPKDLTPGSQPSERNWNGGFAVPQNFNSLPSIGIAVVIAVPVPAWVVIAVAAAMLVYMIGSLSGGGGKSWLDQAGDAIAKVFGW